MTKVKYTKFSFKLIWKNFSLIHFVMIHKTIDTYYLKKLYKSLNPQSYREIVNNLSKPLFNGFGEKLSEWNGPPKTRTPLGEILP